MARGALLAEKGLRNLRSREIRFAEAYAKMLMAGEIDWKFLGNIYDTTESIPELKARSVVRRAHIQKMVRDEISKALEEVGITGKTILKNFLDIYNSCVEVGEDGEVKVTDKNYALKVNTELADIANMKNTTKQITTTRKQIDYKEVIDNTERSAQLTETTKKPEE